MSIIKGTNQIVAGFGGTKRSIGEVYFSQSALATDNSGALPLFTGETIASANTIYPEFYNWVSAHTALQCTSAEYESALTNYGECAKYVIGAGSLRLPLIKNYIKATNPSEGIKNIEAGLPNIMGDVLPNEESGNTWTLKTGLCSGAFSAITNSPSVASVASVEQNKPAGIRFDASKYNAVYGASSTVTPASTTLYPWVVAYTAAVPASTAQAAEFTAALTGKADTNLGNVTSAGKETVLTWAMPDLTAGVEVSFPLSTSKFTAPSKGYYYAMGFISGNYSQAVVNGVTIPVGFWGRTTTNVDGSSVSILLDKGDELYFTNNLIQVIGSSFYPLKGD